MGGSVALLDAFYAASLGCAPEDLNASGLRVVEATLGAIRFAKGYPLLVYGLAKPAGGVIAVRPGWRKTIEGMIRGATTLDDVTCAALEETLSPLLGSSSWFSGTRLFCEPATFVDCRTGEVREISPGEDEKTLLLHDRWQGKVFGQIIEGRIVSRAAVKPLSCRVWDIAVETEPDHRGRGYARSVVSAALVHIFACGVLAGWGCDRTNFASLHVARAVGFRPYGLDFGCIAEA